jgi:hypothetical protein
MPFVSSIIARLITTSELVDVAILVFAFSDCVVGRHKSGTRSI